ncbi:hypothetical protein GRS96_17145 [Rathayibacter sp. VKM Ac-2803]|uniref:hypothetical protein n=1 Tax=Rathayibacter sp. VKM Ac-2803 TaxID=2609256 RepID=UPI0013599318|nr:hypothetical protein [Rathayibacter sp. VKM Ac-2803]MWV50997.1 hypothetical protein [Rathayibacter sp. VKM Ac-2803]
MSHDSTPAPLDAERVVSRRSVAAAAWTVPVVAVAMTAPSASASGDVDLGAYTLTGDCGILSVIGPGFLLKAGPTTPLPVGTTVTIVGSGVGNIGVFSASPLIASVAFLGPSSRQVTLTQALAAGATLQIRTTLSISVAFTLNGVTTLPIGYTATGAKPAGNVNSTLILCSEN